MNISWCSILGSNQGSFWECVLIDIWPLHSACSGELWSPCWSTSPVPIITYKPSGKKIVSRKFNGTCIWYKRTFDLFNVHIFIHLLILFSPSLAKGCCKSVLWQVVAVDFPLDNLNYQWAHQQSPKAIGRENV